MNTDFFTLLAAVAPVFIVVACGASLRILGKLKQSADSSLLSVAVNFLYPCFIADVVINSNALRNPGNVVFAPAVGCATLLIGFPVAFGVAMLMRLNRPQPARTFAFASAIPNWGYLAIPVVQNLFPAQKNDTLGVLLKYQDDISRMQGTEAKRILDQAAETGRLIGGLIRRCARAG